MASSTIKLIDTMEFAKKLNFLRPSAIGNFLEPAKTSANLVMQTMLAPPFVWRWNRDVSVFTLNSQNVQNFVLTGVTAGAGFGTYLGTVTGGAANAFAGFIFKVTGFTGIYIPNNGSYLCIASTATSLTLINAAAVTVTAAGTAASNQITDYTQNLPDFSYIETASIQDPTSAKWYQTTVQMGLSLVSEVGRPRFISAQTDLGDGNIGFRVMPAPDQNYPVSLTFQKRPPLFTSTKQTWAPIPDEYSRIYNWGFLALMWLFADDQRWQLANQKFVTSILSVNQGLDEMQRNIFLGNWEMITGQPAENAIRQQQGIQARGV